MAHYAPLANGDSFLLVKYDADGKVDEWESQNLAVVPGMRALTLDLRKAVREAVLGFYGTSADGADDPLARIAGVQIIQTQHHELKADGEAVELHELAPTRSPR